MKQGKEKLRKRIKKRLQKHLGKGLKKENIWNIPNSLTFIRVILTFVIAYLIFAGFGMFTIAILFAIGMFTDFLDGQIARRFNMTTEFGRKFDMLADRLLMIGTAVALVVDFGTRGTLTQWHLLQIVLILSREIISFPFAVIAYFMGYSLPQARFIGKLTTFLQGFALPIILLSIYYPVFGFAPYLAVVTSVVGVASAIVYINDLKNQGINKK